MSEEKPGVGIIMGSRSDWPTLKAAADVLDAARRRPTRPRSSRPTAPRSGSTTTPQRARARAQGDHRRRRRRRAPARHDGLDDRAAGARRADREPRRSKASTACSPSPRCRPAFRSARSPSARPAPPMPACWRPQILALCDDRRSPPASPPCARRRPTASPRPSRIMPDAPLPPGSTIGILGGGQLGRMLALAAARLGLKTPHLFRRGRRAGLRRRAAPHGRQL